jgi:hypothetical protein
MTYVNLTPGQVYGLVGDDFGTVQAMVRAEKYGRAMSHGAVIAHSGYADGCAEFCAATALYRVTF